MRLVVLICLVGCASGCERSESSRPLYALLLNGGSTPKQNYSSHVAHLTKMQALLQRAGVNAGQVSVFASDGAARAADLVTAFPAQGEAAWLLEGTTLEC